MDPRVLFQQHHLQWVRKVTFRQICPKRKKAPAVAEKHINNRKTPQNGEVNN
jgi:hypothetical protein